VVHPLLRVGTWAEQRTVRGNEAAFSADSRLLAVGDGTGVVRLEATDTGREVARLEVTDPTWLTPIGFSPDGGRLYACGDENAALYIWDLRLLRSRLKAMNADWDWPKLPPAEPIEPVTAVEVIPSKP